MPDTAPLLPSEPSQNTSEPSLPPPPPSIQLTPLFGQAPSEFAQTLYSLYASQVATLIWTAEAAGEADGGRRGIVVGVALRGSPENGDSRGHEQKVFLGVMTMIQEMLKQT
jgi:proteasome assembly chaperone 3